MRAIFRRIGLPMPWILPAVVEAPSPPVEAEAVPYEPPPIPETELT